MTTPTATRILWLSRSYGHLTLVWLLLLFAGGVSGFFAPPSSRQSRPRPRPCPCPCPCPRHPYGRSTGALVVLGGINRGPSKRTASSTPDDNHHHDMDTSSSSPSPSCSPPRQRRNHASSPPLPLASSLSLCVGEQSNHHRPIHTVGRMLATAMILLGLSFSVSTTASSSFLPVAQATDGARLIGEIQGSGIVFKDTLNVESFADPKIDGVTLYISNFQRPLTERLSNKDFFNDPSYASVGCAQTKKTVRVADTLDRSNNKQGEEVFEESRSLLFKTLRVQRIYDAETNTVVYVSFNTRLDKSEDTNKSRFKSSICAVHLN